MKFWGRRATFRQQGAAILTAMLTVVLVASLAASTLWQQWRGVEIEAAERARVQAAWVLTGALDWARLILREDGRKGGADHLAEPWAVPLEQARMSTFLAADRSDTVDEDGIQGAFLSGRMIDLQSRLNLSNLVQAGKIDEPARLAFGRLFDLLKLPVEELDAMTDNLRLMQDSSAAGLANTEAPLWPQEIEQLAGLGLSPLTIAQLRPYVTILPVPTPVNLNTAAAEVIYASVNELELADATRLVRERDAKHLSALTDASTAAGKASAKFNAAQHSVSSRFFEVRGSLQLGLVTVQEQSLVQREGMEVKALRRKRSVSAPVANLQ